ncbi:hypothetical protein HK104_010613 [Borealophlyctis nickersoniae]|nr:hypothetical protein HK104_010613 [Borealophlyctis nickersoniae]
MLVVGAVVDTEEDVEARMMRHVNVGFHVLLGSFDIELEHKDIMITVATKASVDITTLIIPYSEHGKFNWTMGGRGDNGYRGGGGYQGGMGISGGYQGDY